MAREISQKRIEANRRNAQKSTGPRTAEGKAKSAANATTHGLSSLRRSGNPLGPGCFLALEDESQFVALLGEYVDTYLPQHRDELDILTEAVYAKWRQNRLWVSETNQLEIAIAENEEALVKSLPRANNTAHLANGFAKSEGILKLYLRYDAQLHRHYRNCLKDLRSLQAERALSAPPRDPAPNEPNPSAPDDVIPVAHVPEPAPQPQPESEMLQPEIVTPPAVPNEPKPATELTDNERFEAYRARLLDQFGSSPKSGERTD